MRIWCTDYYPRNLSWVPYVILLLALLVVIYQLSVEQPFQPGWPPRIESVPASLQIERLAVRPGDVFKGRSVSLLGMGINNPIDWGSIFPLYYFEYRNALANDLRNDASALNVPVADEYGHFISPPMLALVAAAFYDSRDSIGRAAQVLRVYRPNLARLLGVALIVSDQPILGEELLYQGIANRHPVYVHAVKNANVGQYSPTRIVVAADAGQILDQLQSPDFDGRELAVVEAPLPEPLVAAENVVVRLGYGPKIRVAASSPGLSLLVLPFDWSHCLRARGPGLKALIPVNLAQSGLLIEGTADVEIDYRLGMLCAADCRAADVQRVRRLKLEDAAVGRLFRDIRED